MFGLEKYGWGIRDNVAAVAAHIVAKNEARNQVAFYRKTLTFPTNPQDKAAMDTVLGLLEPQIALMLGERPGTAEHANYLWVVNDMMRVIDECSKDAKAKADLAAWKVEEAKKEAAFEALPVAQKIEHLREKIENWRSQSAWLASAPGLSQMAIASLEKKLEALESAK
jgi:hypothetical protein